jgi:hypothetical protein
MFKTLEYNNKLTTNTHKTISQEEPFQDFIIKNLLRISVPGTQYCEM